MTDTKIVQETQFPNFNIQILKSQSGLVILGCLLIVFVLQFFSQKSKGKLATSYWGGSKEKAAAARKARGQIKNPERNSVALYIGTPNK